MLRYQTNKIYLNYEIGKNQSAIMDIFPYAKAGVNLEDFLPNCLITDSIYLEDYRGVNIYISPEAFITFIKDWRQAAPHFKLFSWEINDWIASYLQGLIIFAKVNNEHTYDEIFMPEEIVLKYIEAILKDFPNYPKNHVINFPQGPLDIEVSWKIEIALYNMLHKQDIFYEDELNAYIQDNIKRMKEQMAMLNYHTKAPIVKINLPLNDKVKLTNIDYYNPDSFLYFYNPFSEERIRTNYLHIRKCLQAYKEQYDSLINPTLF